MNKEVQVIISECAFIGDDWRVLKRKEEKSFHNYIAAKKYADKKTAKGLSVIIRPIYNEKDSKGEFFREWRSFNGEAFTEVKWRF
jgi:hypothetical protein